MYDYKIHLQVDKILEQQGINVKNEPFFYARLQANLPAIVYLYQELYGHREDADELFQKIITTTTLAYANRSAAMKRNDLSKLEEDGWFLSNQLTGMSLYVDRFCGGLPYVRDKLEYLRQLGVNVLHLMPLFQSPEGESDGGYAVSDFRKIDPRLGTLDALVELQQEMQQQNMYLMIDIVLNHTSHRHQWAERAKAGDRFYKEFYYMYDDRQMPDAFERAMPEVFPDAAPGNFTYIPECNQWVMTVFHRYQWDLNYTNPHVFEAMLDTILFYANLGVDILRIDAPAFIWKEPGTSCQNLPKAHSLLRLIKQLVQVASPGMALLGEAIVAPADIMGYFGTGLFTARECDFAYNATQMALQWDALATGNITIMEAAQHILEQKPKGTSWITYTRCHDDIGLGYDDYLIEQAGYNAYEHRSFLKNFYSGQFEGSTARGALFSVNPKTGDARISGTLASLCGLEQALTAGNEAEVAISIKKVALMQAMSFFVGGMPMLFSGDELGATNDYTYLDDPARSYDNRWMHRPQMDWSKIARIEDELTIEHRIFSATKRLIDLRKALGAFADKTNITWINTGSTHVAGFVRSSEEERIFCFFNFSAKEVAIAPEVLKQHPGIRKARDHWNGLDYDFEGDAPVLAIKGYSFIILEALPHT